MTTIAASGLAAFAQDDDGLDALAPVPAAQRAHAGLVNVCRQHLDGRGIAWCVMVRSADGAMTYAASSDATGPDTMGTLSVWADKLRQAEAALSSIGVPVGSA